MPAKVRRYNVDTGKLPLYSSGKLKMVLRYKIIAGLLLAFYALCTVCPERLVSGLATQLAAASEAHDCHNPGKRKPESDCHTTFSEFLPTAEVKFPHVLTVHALSLPQHVLPLVFDLSLRLRVTHFSTAGRPIASLRFNLRI